MPHMPRPALHLALALACALAGPAAHAEKADSRLPMEIQADRSGSADLQQQVSRFEGHVVLTQGTLLIKADRVEVRQTPEGYYQASAWGSPTAPVSYRQKREGVDEYVEGHAQRAEYDGKSEVLRLIGNALVRRTEGSRVLDEITGAQITWNHALEQFSAQGGSGNASVGATAASGAADARVRAVLVPRNTAPAASAPAPAPASTPAPRPGRR